MNQDDVRFLAGVCTKECAAGPGVQPTLVLLTLLGPGGGIVPPRRIFAYNRAITRASVLKKLDFSQL